MTGRWRLALLAALGLALLAAALFFLQPRRPAPPAPVPVPAFTLSEAKAYFLENPHLGRLYVVEGTVGNNLGVPQCRISIKATLLDTSGSKVAEEFFEAGLTASISELKFLNGSELKAKLAPEGSRACQATTVGPGERAPFMALFVEPPESAVSFTLAVAGSQAPR